MTTPRNVEIGEHALWAGIGAGVTSYVLSSDRPIQIAAVVSVATYAGGMYFGPPSEGVKGLYGPLLLSAGVLWFFAPMRLDRVALVVAGAAVLPRLVMDIKSNDERGPATAAGFIAGLSAAVI